MVIIQHYFMMMIMKMGKGHDNDDVDGDHHQNAYFI